MENSNIEESFTLLDEAIKIKSNVNILTQKGIYLLKEEKYNEAIIIFDEALNLDQKKTKAFIGKGQALFGLNKIKESIEEYDKALNIEPNNINAIYSKANSLMKSGQKQEALELYQKGNDLNEENNNCINLINYVLCLIEMKKFEDVKNIVDRAQKLYEKQEGQLTEKEKNFYKKNIDKIKRKNKKLFK